MPSPHLNFDNSYARLPGAFYTKLTPTPPSGPLGFHLNHPLASLVGIDPNADDLLVYLGGYKMFAGAEPLAAVYAGHQFGAFVPRLGDGRAILLGEVIGGDQKRYDLVLKGAGKTPYSRMGDGRAVLRSSLREYVVGEYLHALGVPTTRALSLVLASEPVQREVSEPSATIIRTAPTHLRFGSFEYFHYSGQFAAIKQLADYAIGLFWPQFAQRPDGYLQWYFDIMRRTAELMALWQNTGFVHGVMNTDNMSLLGLTMDFGPYGFLDNYLPDQVFNHTDARGRYAYDQQPGIGLWNLQALAHALSSILTYEMVTEVLAHYWPIYTTQFYKQLLARLGLLQLSPEDKPYLVEFLSHMAQHNMDYHHGFLYWRYVIAGEKLPEWLKPPLQNWPDDWQAWYRTRREGQDSQRTTDLIKTRNPIFYLRTHLLQRCIDDVAGGRWQSLDRLMWYAQNPYVEYTQDAAEYLSAPLVPTASGCLSCSS